MVVPQAVHKSNLHCSQIQPILFAFSWVYFGMLNSFNVTLISIESCENWNYWANVNLQELISLRIVMTLKYLLIWFDKYLYKQLRIIMVFDEFMDENVWFDQSIAASCMTDLLSANDRLWASWPVWGQGRCHWAQCSPDGDGTRVKRKLQSKVSLRWKDLGGLSERVLEKREKQTVFGSIQIDESVWESLLDSLPIQ